MSLGPNPRPAVAYGKADDTYVYAGGMTYGITVCTMDGWPIVQITEAEFNAIKRAKACLLTVLSVEEKFDTVLKNYADYERELLATVLDRMVH